MKHNFAKWVTLFMVFGVLLAVLTACDGDEQTPSTPTDQVSTGTYTERGLELSLNDTGTSYTVSGIGTCKDTDLYIPSEYQGLPVTSIGDDAFYWCSSLTSITIPDSVTSIGNGAFYGCSSLTSVTIPDSVTSIGKSTFFGCSGLTSVTIGDSVRSIGEYAFSSCSSLANIEVSEGNTVYHADGNCLIETASHTLIVWCQNSIIPTDGSVTTIGDYAFFGCTDLTRITIPDSVTSIGKYAFENCSSLTSVTIGYSVTSIGDGAFSGCSNLANITFEGTIEQWNAIEKSSDWSKNWHGGVVCTDSNF